MAARLYGLDEMRATAALGIAGSSSGGLLAFLGTGASTKQLHPGLASHAGVLAARLAAAGATGPETVFDGPHGLYDALATGTVDRGSIVEGLGERWETTRIGIKPYAACQLSHATVDAVRAAVADGDVDADDVEDVVVEVHPRFGRRRVRRAPRPRPAGQSLRGEVLPAVDRRGAARRR